MKPNVKKRSSSKSTLAVATKPAGIAIELPEGMWDRISQKAYELWRERGSREGYALQDWLDAEAIVMEEIHEARE
ncbi:MAG: DUF2934 domain-containing protein [Nitrospira sp.]|nr:DUF2934 domain-containing protein [Nitrospira sp.]